MVYSYGGYDVKSIGLLGSCLYFVYFLICLSRTFILWRDEEDFEPKVIFHLVLTSNSIFELIYFIAMLLLNRYINIIIERYKDRVISLYLLFITLFIPFY